MHLYLKSTRGETLEEAHDYLQGTIEEDRLQVLERAEDGSSAEYMVDLSDQKCISLLEQLLVDFPDIDITGVIQSDVEGRDRSFWSTTRYQSTVNDNGERIFEASSSTNWC